MKCLLPLKLSILYFKLIVVLSNNIGTFSSLISAKGLFFYPGIILSAGWTTLNIFKMFHSAEGLRSEFPHCTATNPLKLQISLATVGALALFKYPIERGARALFQRSLPKGKFPQGSTLRESKAEMLGERVFKLIINVVCVVSLLKIMTGDDCDFMDVRIGGTN